MRLRLTTGKLDERLLRVRVLYSRSGSVSATTAPVFEQNWERELSSGRLAVPGWLESLLVPRAEYFLVFWA